MVEIDWLWASYFRVLLNCPGVENKGGAPDYKSPQKIEWEVAV